MREIPLSSGRVALIDDEDYERVAQFKWSYHRQGYAFRGYGPRNARQYIYMHRFIMGDPEGLVDHRNRDGLDNRRANLRITDKSGNGLNQDPGSRNRSGHVGVSWSKIHKHWDVRLKVGPKLYRAKFRDFEEAVAARQKMMDDLTG